MNCNNLLCWIFTFHSNNSTYPPPPQDRSHPLNRIENRYDTIFACGGSTKKGPQKPYTKFGPDIQRTCHDYSTHHCTMSYKASIRENVVVSFHMWTTSVQGNCTQNLDKKFAQLLFERDRFHSCSLVSPFKISVCNSTYLHPFRSPLNKKDHRNNTIFFFWGWTTKAPRKPYNKFGPDFQRTCHAIRS